MRIHFKGLIAEGILACSLYRDGKVLN